MQFCGDSRYVTTYKTDLEYAVKKGSLDPSQVEPLWEDLQQRSSERYRNSVSNIAYYSGAFLIIGSLTWFASLAWRDPDSLSLFYLASSYSFSFGYAGWYCWKNVQPKIVGGLFASIAVCISPVAVFGLQRYFDFWIHNAPSSPQDIT